MYTKYLQAHQREMKNKTESQTLPPNSKFKLLIEALPVFIHKQCRNTGFIQMSQISIEV